MKPSVATEALLEVPFRLESMAPVPAPEGSDGIWYRYVICQGTNEITGLRSGSQAEVTRLLDEMIERLNERRLGKAKKK